VPSRGFTRAFRAGFGTITGLPVARSLWPQATGNAFVVVTVLGEALFLVTSRLSLVEAARAILLLRHTGGASEDRLADAARSMDALWARCETWELTPTVCDLAGQVAPHKSLRTLDALHVATYLLARRRLGDLAMISADERLLDATRAV
jgi:predicted nucleic acid-binding protein